MQGKRIIHLSIPWKNIELGYIIILILKTLTLVISNMLYPHIFIMYVDNLSIYHVVRDIMVSDCHHSKMQSFITKQIWKIIIYSFSILFRIISLLKTLTLVSSNMLYPHVFYIICR